MSSHVSLTGRGADLYRNVTSDERRLYRGTVPATIHDVRAREAENQDADQVAAGTTLRLRMRAEAPPPATTIVNGKIVRKDTLESANPKNPSDTSQKSCWAKFWEGFVNFLKKIFCCSSSSSKP